MISLAATALLFILVSLSNGLAIQSVQAKKVLMITGDLVEDYEVVVPYQTLTLLGYQVDIVSPGKAVNSTIQTAIHEMDPTSSVTQFFTEKLGHQVKINADFDSVDVNAYSGLYVPGGRAPEHLQLNERVLDIVRAFKDRPLASLCHGPLILAAADVLKGKRCSAFIGITTTVKLAGCEYVDLAGDDAIVDGNLVTAPTYDAQPKFLKLFLNLLEGTKVLYQE